MSIERSAINFVKPFKKALVFGNYSLRYDVFRMKTFEKVPAVLLLADGTVFRGKSAGKIGTTFGEICFNTSMTGYQELFTDPSYFGQILVSTNVHVGNYGTRDIESESSAIKINGLIVRNFTNLFSRKMADQSIQEYLLKENLIAISDVDTRAIVRRIRDKGAMNCVISSETTDIAVLQKQLDETPSMEGLELASKVSTSKVYDYGDSNSEYKISVLDLGVKTNILRSFAERGIQMRVFPAKTSFDEMSKWSPNGYFISNGPGDPAAMDYAVETVQEVLNRKLPLFGICLGHQILARACDIPTYKMHHGHRGGNHPVINLATGKCEITTQNHGFGVAPDAINKSEKVEITHVNLNDDTIEGIRVAGVPAFSVQYHPEAAPGPHDSRYLFDEFIEMMKAYTTANSVVSV
ncbi:MAG: carbamoyl-phosphate synthase small subunit [Limisphaerales bacterium]